MDSFWENREKSKNGCFLAIFGLILAMFLTSQPYDFDAFAHAGAPLGVEWLCKISWKSYGQFLRNLKFSWKGREKKTKKQHDCISSQKFFPTPKNLLRVTFLNGLEKGFKLRRIHEKCRAAESLQCDHRLLGDCIICYPRTCFGIKF